MKKRFIAYFWVVLVLLAHPLFGQGGSRSVVQETGYASVSAVRPGDRFKLGVALDVARGYHINAHVPTLDYVIPTTVRFTVPSGFVLEEVQYPEPELKSFTFAPDTKLAVHDGIVVITAGIEAAASLHPGSLKVPVRVRVQACNDQLCLPPADIDFDIPIQAVAAGTPVRETNSDIFSGLKQFQGSPQKDDLADIIASSGLPLALLAVFLAGLALNLTPCVYPLIPITIGFFVNQASSHGKPRLSRTFLLAVMYVFGMAITYSILGVAASMTGGLFGAALQNSFVLIALASVMVALALSMFGVYEFRVPQFLNRFASQSAQSTSGEAGALAMGLTMGIVAAPCIGPFVLGLLVHVSAKADPLYGFVIFFVLALGLGLPYVFLGTFSGAIKELPRSGEWMVAVRKVFGVILIGMALYFLMPLMGGSENLVFIIFFGASAFYLFFWESGRTRPKAFAWILRAIGVGAAAIAVSMAIPDRPEKTISWQPYSEESLVAAQREGRPVVIDVFADWCIPCKELDHQTFSDDGVRQEAMRFVTLKLNLTFSDPDTEAGRARKRFDILGVPTVIFLNANGQEHSGLRVTGFEGPTHFLSRLRQIPLSASR